MTHLVGRIAENLIRGTFDGRCSSILAVLSQEKTTSQLASFGIGRATNYVLATSITTRASCCALKTKWVSKIAYRDCVYLIKIDSPASK